MKADGSGTTAKIGDVNYTDTAGGVSAAGFDFDISANAPAQKVLRSERPRSGW